MNCKSTLFDSDKKWHWMSLRPEPKKWTICLKNSKITLPPHRCLSFTIPPLVRLLRHSALLACCTTNIIIRPIHALKMSNVLQVKFLSPNAVMPTRGSPQSAGFDLSAAEPKVVPAGGRAVVKTDLSIACPEGTYARIAPRRYVRLIAVVKSFFRGHVQRT